MTTHEVLGTEVQMPVRIRHASCFVAGFTASAPAAQAMIAGTGLRVMQVRPGRTMCMLVFVDYVDGDLGPYNEFGVCLLLEDPDTPGKSTILGNLRSLATGQARALVHRLPVDGDFTLAAGRGIWGFPKTLADFDVDHSSATKRGAVSEAGTLIAALTIRPGFRVPDSDATAVLRAYSHLGGATRETPWVLNRTGDTRTRPGGATLQLGSHPIADELRGLRLSRHALMTSSVGHIEMTFEDAVVRGGSQQHP
jgi:Acetoacetate decarboxylase (ADC)